VDPSGFIVYANPEVTSLLGCSPDSVKDQPISLYLHRRMDVDRIAAALHAESRARIEGVEVLTQDGSAVAVSVWASPLYSPEGRELGSVAYLRKAQESQAALERKNAELEHTLRAVSHDLRSPLVALLGFTRLLREDFQPALGERGGHFLDRIEQAGRTMESLIHDLLEISRIRTAQLRKSLVDPREVVLQLQAELKPRLEESGIRLEVPQEMPLICCDRTRLYQVLSNLLGNAIDHMGEPEAPVVAVEVSEDPHGHRVTVRDNGAGIAPEHHESVFEIFQGVGPHVDGRRRTGVGLSIVKKIAETHGGRAWVESEPGRGAAFHVTFPRGAEAEPTGR
jgi:PAS domain S-box-containing protein